jgi:hypothetical protein
MEPKGEAQVKPSPDPGERDMADRQDGRRDAGTDETEIDLILADSFPASDAPPWTFGVTETTPETVDKRKGRSG